MQLSSVQNWCGVGPFGARILSGMNIPNDLSSTSAARAYFVIAFALNVALTLAGILFLPLDHWQQRLFPVVGVLTVVFSALALTSRPRVGGRHRSGPAR